MKRIIILTILFIEIIAFSHPAAAQMNNRRDEIESMKAAFITQRLDLNPAEARVFWPVYNQYQNEIKQIKKRRRSDLLNARDNFDSMNDRDLEALVDGEIMYRQTELDILKKYHPQFKQILGPRKVALLYKSEEEFKRELIRRIKNSR